MSATTKEKYCPDCNRGIGFWSAPDESPCRCTRDKRPKFKIVPCSCHCGGSQAWVKVEEDGVQIMYGCVCHNSLPSNALVVGNA